MIGDLLGALLGGVFGGWLRDRQRARNARRARRGAATGRVVRVVAGLRLPGSGIQSRWRHGYLQLGPDTEFTWIPRRPRPGARVTMPDLTLTGERSLTRLEKWWINPDSRVFQATTADRPIELALLPENVELALARVPRR